LSSTGKGEASGRFHVIFIVLLGVISFACLPFLGQGRSSRSRFCTAASSSSSLHSSSCFSSSSAGSNPQLNRSNPHRLLITALPLQSNSFGFAVDDPFPPKTPLKKLQGNEKEMIIFDFFAACVPVHQP
jgi:hypothetical protein